LLGIGIEADAAGIGIQQLSPVLRSIPVPDWVSLFRYRAGSGIDIFFIPVPE
jgi:hypothetical protein